MTARKKILIADDDFNVHELLNFVLSPNEFEVIHAYDGLETEDSIETHKPDLVILDIMMPFRDGRDICRDLRMKQQRDDILILMLSARDEQFDRILGLEVGADDYIVKPFSPYHVVRKIRRMLAKRRE